MFKLIKNKIKNEKYAGDFFIKYFWDHSSCVELLNQECIKYSKIYMLATFHIALNSHSQELRNITVNFFISSSFLQHIAPLFLLQKQDEF